MNKAAIQDSRTILAHPNDPGLVFTVTVPVSGTWADASGGAQQ